MKFIVDDEEKTFLLLTIIFVCVFFIFSRFILAQPQFSQPATNITNGTQYAPNRVYGFSINITNITGGAAVIQNATFESNHTGTLLNYTQDNITMFNYTNGIWNVTLVDLAAGIYQYRWYAVTTANEWNSSSIFIFNVSKGDQVLFIALNDTLSDRTYELGAIANITVWSNVTGNNITNSMMIYANFTGTVAPILNITGSVVNSLYNLTDTRNIGVGTYIITTNVSETQNYTAYSNSSLYLTVADTTAPTVSLTLSPTSIYQFEVTTPSCSYSDIGGIASYSLSVEKPNGVSVSATCGSPFTDTSLVGTYTMTLTVRDNSGNERSVSDTFRVMAIPPTKEAVPSECCPGAGAPAEEIRYIFDEITSEAPAKLIITKEGIPFREIEIKVKNDVTDVTIKLERVAEKPADLPGIELPVCSYVKITKVNLDDEDVERVKIKFMIEKSWVEDNGIDPKRVYLYRYTTQWIKLPTKKISEDEKYIYYTAETSSLSIFAIAGEKLVAPTTTTVPVTTTVPTTTTVPVTTVPPAPPVEITPTVWIVLILIILAAIVFLIYKKPK